MKKYLGAGPFILILVAVLAGVFVSAAAGLFSNAQSPLPSLTFEGLYDSTKNMAFWHGQNIAVPKSVEGKRDRLAMVLGDSTAEKRIEVDLSKQTLYAYEGNHKVYEFLVSTGLWGRTPTGEFTIWAKPKYTLMTGGNKAWGTYYYLPNVPFVQFFYNNHVSKWQGFSIHGTYWHSNFGHPMSHGCINMKTEEAEQLFYWTNPVFKEGGWATYATKEDPGTKVIIYGETPRE